MMPCGIQVKQRAIQRMRHPRQRMPVRLLGGCQRPRDSVRGQALTDVQILGDVAVVVIVHEGMVVDRVVEGKSDYRKKQAQDRVALFGRREQARWLSRGYSFLCGWQ